MTNVIDTWQLTHISRHYPYLSVDCSVDDARVLEATRKRDPCRRQQFAISHSSSSSSTLYEFIVTLYHRHFHELVPFQISCTSHNLHHFIHKYTLVSSYTFSFNSFYILSFTIQLMSYIIFVIERLNVLLHVF